MGDYMTGIGFDTSKSNGVLGVFFLGTCFAGGLTSCISGILGDMGAANIGLIVAAVFLLLGLLLLFSSRDDTTGIKLPLNLMVVDVLLMAGGGVIINLS